jgi:hypothetical protein
MPAAAENHFGEQGMDFSDVIPVELHDGRLGFQH